jgi:aspartyl-tRNA(Asn)/glutamyl-tRNA(Gln) amidotransferase subunit A
MDDELSWMPAVTLRRLIGERRVSPVEVVTACLARIEAMEPLLHAFITIDGERAVEAARRAENTVGRGENLGALHGIPVALKDEAWTAGIPSTAGSLLFKKFLPVRHGTVAERLEEAGAIIIGKTNMPEFAAWPRSKSRLAGESVNPWDPTRISGASSGGSAAAVAAGLIPVAIGSDGGGSTRIPAALCGAVGLFPTPGRVPSYGSFSYSPAGSLGPIARTVLDVALVQQVIAGPDPRDAAALTEPAPDVLGAIESGVGSIRIAWTPDFGHISLDPRIAQATLATLATIEGAGARVEEIGAHLDHPWGDGSLMADRQAEVAAGSWELADPGPDLPDTSDEQEWMWKVFAGTEPLTATAAFRSLCERHVRLLAPPSQFAYGARQPAAAGDAPLPGAEELKSSLDVILRGYDVLCSPTMPTVAPVAAPGWGTPYGDAYMGTNFTFIANSTGCPAASIPGGLIDGLPVGLQVIGRPGDEATVLRVCRAIEASAPQLPKPTTVTAGE